MKDNYNINRLYLSIFLIGILLVSSSAIINETPSIKRAFSLLIDLCFLYGIFILYSKRVILTDDSIKINTYFSPWHLQIKECKFIDIGRISYEFILFEEIGGFKIYPKDSTDSHIVDINFLINNKKEIIERILEKRPDLKIDGWVKEGVLDYKVVHKKFLLIAAAIIIISIVILLFQR